MSQFDIIRPGQPNEKATGQILVCYCYCARNRSVTQKLKSGNFSSIFRGLLGVYIGWIVRRQTKTYMEIERILWQKL